MSVTNNIDNVIAVKTLKTRDDVILTGSNFVRISNVSRVSTVCLLNICTYVSKTLFFNFVRVRMSDDEMFIPDEDL